MEKYWYRCSWLVSVKQWWAFGLSGCGLILFIYDAIKRLTLLLEMSTTSCWWNKTRLRLFSPKAHHCFMEKYNVLWPLYGAVLFDLCPGPTAKESLLPPWLLFMQRNSPVLTGAIIIASSFTCWFLGWSGDWTWRRRDLGMIGETEMDRLTYLRK